MTTKTYTVLFTENFEGDDGPTDRHQIEFLRDCLQESCDAGHLGGNFLIIGIEDGDDRFWTAWKAANIAAKVPS